MPGWRDLLISICDENKKHMAFAICHLEWRNSRFQARLQHLFFHPKCRMLKLVKEIFKLVLTIKTFHDTIMEH